MWHSRYGGAEATYRCCRGCRRVLAPSFTSITSGFDSKTGFMAPRAVQWFIGIAEALSARRPLNLAFLASLSFWSPGTHVGSIFMPALAMPSVSASRELARSPTTGAAIGRLQSISSGDMSSCMNLVFWLHLPCPRDSSQLRRAPASITTSASAMMVERHEMALRGPLSGRTPFAMDIG